MFRISFLLLPLLGVVVLANHQWYPGTNTRPVLSDSEAAYYTKEAYLQGWAPGQIQHSRADYTVGNGGYAHIQDAVNAAIRAGGTTRKYIHIQKGLYYQIVFIPKTNVPITLYGTYGAPEDVRIVMALGAKMTGSAWANQVNPGGQVFKNGDPAYSMYHSCANKATIGTSCSPVVWAENDNLEISYITIENYSRDGQAVAAKLHGDKQNLDNVHFYGFQDTLYATGKRIYLSQPTIKGDVDFIFGSASAVFDRAQIIARADRLRNSGYVFAPNTDKSHKYGFLVINSKITAESAIQAVRGLNLARAWDSSSKHNANGQLVIRETQIDDVINANAPYAAATGSDKRPFSGNTATNRNLDDPNFNRFWEYKNYGGGA